MGCMVRWKESLSKVTTDVNSAWVVLTPNLENHTVFTEVNKQATEYCNNIQPPMLSDFPYKLWLSTHIHNTFLFVTIVQLFSRISSSSPSPAYIYYTIRLCITDQLYLFLNDFSEVPAPGFYWDNTQLVTGASLMPASMIIELQLLNIINLGLAFLE